MITEPVSATAVILLVGMVAQWIGSRLRVPAIVFLLLAGVLLGPVGGVLDPDATYGDLLFPVVSLAVAVILFEGSLTLGHAGLRAAGAIVTRLLTVGAAVTLVGGAFAAELVLGVERRLAWLVASVLIVTGPTVIGPLVRSIGLRGRVGRILEAEGILIDPMGAVLTVLLFEALFGTGERSTVATLLVAVAAGIGFGLVAAGLLTVLLSRFLLPDHLQSVATLAVVLAAFAAADHVQAESGLLAVTTAGVALGAQRRAHVKDILAFNETLGTLFISGVFVVLAARITGETLSDVGAPTLLFLAVMVLVVRPIAVALSTLGSDLERNGRLFLAATAPRGIVAAAISSLFALRLAETGSADGQVLVTATFTVIAGTVLLSGFGARPLASRLGLIDTGVGPVLIVGAGTFPRSLAATLNDLGEDVDVHALLIATDEEDRRAAKMGGLAHTSGSVLEAATWERAGVADASVVLALDRTDEVNTVAARHAASVVGRRNTFQAPLDPSPRRTVAPVEVVGRPLFAHDATVAELERRVCDGWKVRATPFTEAFDWREYHRVHPRAIPLAVVRNGRVTWLEAGHQPKVGSGGVVVALTPPRDGATPG